MASVSQLPQRVSCNQICAVLVQQVRASEQAQESTSPSKIDVTIKSPVGDISVVTLIRTDTTLDHSQKAEKVWVTWQTLWHSNNAEYEQGLHQPLSTLMQVTYRNNMLEPKLPKNWCSHIDASLSRQPLVKGERLVRYEVNAVMWRLHVVRWWH